MEIQQKKCPTVPWKPIGMTNMTRSKSLHVYILAEEENTFLGFSTPGDNLRPLWHPSKTQGFSDWNHQVMVPRLCATPLFWRRRRCLAIVSAEG